MFILKDIVAHSYTEFNTMVTKKEFGLDYGDRIEVGVRDSNGEISDADMAGCQIKRKATVVGFDEAGFPLIMMEGVDIRSGAWALESETHAREFKMNLATVDYKVEKYYLLFSDKAFQKLTTSSTKGTTDMKFDLKVGDRVIASLGASGGFSAVDWQETGKHISGTVVGQKPDGTPLVYFDEGNGALWDASYNGAVGNIDASMTGKVDVHSKRCNYIVGEGAFVSEKNYKAGKRPVAVSKDFFAVCDQLQVNATANREAGDHREFMKFVTDQLPTTSYIYGEHIRDLLLKNKLAENDKTDIFCADVASAKTLVTGLKAAFSNEYVVQARTFEEGELIKEEWSIRYRCNMPNYKAFKVHVAYPKVGSQVKSPFESGGADLNAFMIKQGRILSNFHQKDINIALANLSKKEFAVIGQLGKELLEELVKKGFTQTKGNKGVKSMSNVKQGDSLMALLKEDFKKSTYRVAADQMTAGVKEALVLLVKNKGGSASQLEGLMMLLDSEGGEAAISLLLGIGLLYAPMISDDPRAQKLAESFRQNGMTTAGNLVVSTALQTFLPVVQGVLAKMPEEEQVRVHEPARIATPVEEVIAEEEVAAPMAKQATL